MLTEGVSTLPKLSIQTGNKDCVMSWGISPLNNASIFLFMNALFKNVCVLELESKK